jgi:hypothetical protein
MSNFNVGKIKNKQHEIIELRNFEELNEAENYAQITSLHDKYYFYM